MNWLVWILPGFCHDVIHWLTGMRMVQYSPLTGGDSYVFKWMNDPQYEAEFGKK